MKTEWITKEQVKLAAAAGKLEALEMSLKHHQQGRDCTRGELVDAIEIDNFAFGVNHCSCCVHAGSKCRKCPVDGGGKGSMDETCCDGTYNVARLFYIDFKNNPTKNNFTTFQTAEAKVCEYIESVIEKEREPKLDYSKPIMAVNDKNNEKLILLPAVGDGYNYKGYDWFRLSDMRWNSCHHWDTQEAAVNAYSSHDISNVSFDDIAAKSKTLDRFMTKGWGGTSITVIADKVGDVSIRPSLKGCASIIKNEDLDEFILKLQQVRNGAKQQQHAKK